MKSTVIGIFCERNIGVLQNTKQVLISSSIMNKVSIGIITVWLYPSVLALYLAIKESASLEVSLSYYLRIPISTEDSYTQIYKAVTSDDTIFKMVRKHLY